MEKKINIMGKEYEVCINAYTPLLYKKVFKTGFMGDLARLSKITLNNEDIRKELQGKNLSDEEIEQRINVETMESLDGLLEVITQIAYIMILGKNKNFKPYDEWMSEQETFSISDNWIAEVTELAVSSFR